MSTFEWNKGDETFNWFLQTTIQQLRETH